jgi:gluconokinase
LLASELGWEFADADSYHSAENIDKMRNGIALTDCDRAPWLGALCDQIAAWLGAGKNAVLACSALRMAYREELQVSCEVKFVYLKVGRESLRRRLHERRGHYMTEKMLASQLATLEEPDAGLAVDGERMPTQIVAEVRSRFGLG